MHLEEYSFSESEIEQLKRYRDAQQDIRLQKRFLALLMLAEQVKLESVTSILGISKYTVQNWLSQYLKKGIEALNSFQYQPKQPELDEQQSAQLAQWVKKKTPGNREMIQLYIQEQFQITYSLSGVSRVMHRLGLKKIRPKTIPGKGPDLEDQVRFVYRYFEVQGFAQKDPGMVQLFGDGMHLHHQLIPRALWADPAQPPVFPTNSNRKRLNILGAYEPATLRFIHHTSEENCDAKRAVAFLERVHQSYLGKHSIILYLDNAPYFHAPLVQDWLKQHPHLILEPLPTYAPNLNLIERLWRFVKGKLVVNRYYEKYITFRAQVFQLLNHLQDYHKELESLMTQRFQLIAHF